MKIHFSNVGQIKQLDFELKRGLTLLCGPNSTGKTYAAYTIFSILTRFEDIEAAWMSSEDLKNLLEHGNFNLNFNDLRCSADFLGNISKKLNRHLSDDFDAPDDFFGENAICISELDKRRDLRKKIKSEFSAGLHSFVFSLVENVMSISVTSRLSEDDGNVFPVFPMEVLLSVVNKNISDLYASAYLGQSYVLTAERSAINLFSRELSSSRNNLVDQLLSLDKHGKKARIRNIREVFEGKARRYSLPIRTGLEVAEDLKEISKRKGELAEYADKLEELILGGKIQLGENGELVFRGTNNKNLAINLTASMIKSLASLIIYLRYQSSKGDLLIIDEPELNLHPDNQRKLARFLCELVNAGVDVMISTHSDYIIREVNNLIILNHPSLSEVKERHAYQDEQLIKPELVSVVLFGTDGLPQQMVVDNKGFAVASIDDEINKLNRISSEIMLEIEE